MIPATTTTNKEIQSKSAFTIPIFYYLCGKDCATGERKPILIGHTEECLSKPGFIYGKYTDHIYLITTYEVKNNIFFFIPFIFKRNNEL